MVAKRLLGALAALGMMMGAGMAHAADGAQHYYLFVFATLPSGKDAAYKHWQAEYIADMLKVPGFESAQPLHYSEAQLTPEALRQQITKNRNADFISKAKQMHPYGVAFQFTSADLHATYAEVHKREASFPKPPQGMVESTYTWHIVSPMITAKPGPDSFAPLPAKTYYELVFNTPLDGKEAEYNDWYEHSHGSVGGEMHARERMKLADEQLSGKPVIPTYLTLYQLVSPDVAARFKKSQEGLLKGFKENPNRSMDFPYDQTTDFNLVYEWDGAAITKP